MAQRTGNRQRKTETRRASRDRRGPIVTEHPLAPLQRGAVVAAVAAVLLLFTNATNDVYVVPKATAFWLLTALLIGLTVWRVADDGVIAVPSSPAFRLMTATVVVLGLASLVNAHRALSFVGEYGRNGGLASYVAALIVAAVVLVAFDRRTLTLLAWGFAATSALVVLYAMLEALGFEPATIPAHVAIVGTLGQPNFIGAFLGIATPFFLWIAVRRDLDSRLRIAGAAFAVATVLLVPVSQSFQAYFSVGAAVVVFAIAVLPGRLPGTWLRCGAFGIVIFGAGAGLLLHHRIEHEIRSGLDERVLLWQAAGHLIKRRPFLGWGMDGFASHFGEVRPRAHAVRFGPFQLADAPHSVPLGITVSAGFVGLAVYLAFVVAVGIVLVRGLRTSEGPTRLLLAAFGSAWAAYEVQSLVSIDMVSFVTIHLILAATIVLLAGRAEPHLVPLPWHRRRGAPGPGPTALKAVAAVLVVLVAWQAVRPWRADTAAARGEDHRAAQATLAAVADFRTATALAPWNGLYWAKYAAALVASGNTTLAVDAGRRAVAAAPSYTSYALSEAQLLARLGRLDEADRLFTEATKRAPYLPVAYLAHAQFLNGQHRFREAVPLARRALELHGDDADYLVALGEALAGSGDVDGARKAFERTHAIQPGNAIANDFLQKAG